MSARRLLELRQMEYTDYLRTPEWQEIRREALRRAKNRCQICNDNTYNLHVHHRTYENKGDEDLSDLVVLCSDCHQIFHEAKKIISTASKDDYRPWYTDAEFMELIKY